MAAVSLLDENDHPTEREVREGLEGNLCRCTGYHNIVKAVLDCAGVLESTPGPISWPTPVAVTIGADGDGGRGADGSSS